MKNNNIQFILIIVAGLFCIDTFADEKIFYASYEHPISSKNFPVILSGNIDGLEGKEIGKISLYKVQNQKLVPIPFQIDRKNDAGEFLLPITQTEKNNEPAFSLTAQDEIVLLSSDLGDKLNNTAIIQNYTSLVEILITDTSQQESGYIYAFAGLSDADKSKDDYVSYKAEEDIIDTVIYRIGYSKEKKFLINRIQWRDRDTKIPGLNIASTMKIKHEGKLFHLFPFERDENDYTSELVAVKDGSVRVIRITSNRIYMFMGIESPSVVINNIHYKDSFVMDVVVDFPFRIGILFDDLVTTPSLELSDDEDLPVAVIFSQSEMKGIKADSDVSEDQSRFNQSGDTSFVIANSFGNLPSDMSFEAGSPIKSNVFISDAGNASRNVGFRTTEWEELDSQTHHIFFRAYMLDPGSAEDSLKLLSLSPGL